jgi:hypothetical protein
MGASSETPDQIRERIKWKYYVGGGGNGYDDVGLEQAINEEMQLQRARGAFGDASGGGSIAHNPSGSEVLQDPGYAFGLQQGQQAIDRKIAASGGRVSGAAIKAAGQYGTNYASTKYGEAYQRRQDALNRLMSIAGLGQTSTAGSAAAGANSANAISSLLSDTGSTMAGARLAQGSIWGNTANQVGAILSRQRRPSGYAGYGGSGVPADDWSGQGYY